MAREAPLAFAAQTAENAAWNAAGSASSAASSAAPNVGAQMLARLGHTPGRGLGKHEQGPSSAPRVASHIDNFGIGYHVAGLTDVAAPASPTEEKIVPLPPPEWLHGDGAVGDGAVLPDAETLEKWVELAPRSLTLEDEVSFVDGEELSAMLRAKTALDEVEKGRAFNAARERANPYEGIKNECFMNRAAIKMAAMDAACDYLFTLPGLAPAGAHEIVARRLSDEAAAAAAEAAVKTGRGEPTPAPTASALRGDAGSGNSLLYFCDVAAGPGGFAEYVLWRRGPSAKGVGFTLKAKHDFKPDAFHIHAAPEAFHPYYGPDRDGDLYSTVNLRALRNLAQRQTKGEWMHLVMGDGGFDVSGNENVQEILNKQLLLAQCIVAFATLRAGGAFVCKAFDLFTPFSASLVYLLHRCFDRICIYKPAQSRPANSERYLLCHGYRRSEHTEVLVKHLLGVNEQLNELKPGWAKKRPGKDVASLVPLRVMQDSPFGAYLTDSNNRFIKAQRRALRQLVGYMHDRSGRAADHAAVRTECLKQWGLPEQASYGIPRRNAEDFFHYELQQCETCKRREVVPKPLRAADADLANPACRLRLWHDWVVFESSPAAPSLLIGVDGEARGTAFQHRQSDRGNTWACVDGLRLPHRTLILAEVCGETVYALDAAMLAGDNVRRLAYADRRTRLALFIDAIEGDEMVLNAEARARGDGAAARVRLRLKPACGLDEIDKMKAHHGLLFVPARGTVAAEGQAKRPMSFHNCMGAYSQWVRAAPGDVSWEQLTQLAAQAQARAQERAQERA